MLLTLRMNQTSFKTAINHLIKNCYFNVGNMTMKQAMSIPVEIDPAPFWANLFLYSYEEEYMSSLISSDKSWKDISTQQSASLMIFAL